MKYLQREKGINVQEQEIILNLCDRSIKTIYSKDNEWNPSFIQVGSYTCGNYFINLMKEINNLEKGSFDLVIPTFAEHQLNIIKTKEFLDCCDNCRQIVVNDFGMLNILHTTYNNVRLGRLFFKDYRDHRYSDYDKSKYCGKVFALVDFIEKCKIKIVAIENDIITQNYQVLSNNEKIKIYLHYPYRQVSMSHICEYASIGKKIEEKYIPDDNCTMQCLKIKIKSNEYGYLKIGKSVFEILNEQYLRNFNNKNNFIITPRW